MVGEMFWPTHVIQIYLGCQKNIGISKGHLQNRLETSDDLPLQFYWICVFVDGGYHGDCVGDD